MSVKALTWAFEQPISATEKVVLLALADHANEHGLCWPSISLLVQRAHVGERTVQRAIQALEDGGFITRERRQRENGSDTSNLYRLCLNVAQGGQAWTSVDQRGSGGVNLAPHPVGGVTQTGGEGVIQTGGEDGLHDTPRTVIKNRKKEPSKDISVDSDFEEFWAAYPRRNGPNPKAKAREKYNQMRRANVSHETLMAGVNKLAASRKGEDPKFTPQAATWLNQRRWEDEDAVAESIPDVSQEFFDEIANGYPGVVDPGVRLELAKMISGGIQPVEITDAAMKLRLLDKQRRAEGIPMPIPPLSKWLKFRWREMEGYEFCRSGMGNKLSVRPIRKG